MRGLITVNKAQLNCVKYRYSSVINTSLAPNCYGVELCSYGAALHSLYDPVRDNPKDWLFTLPSFLALITDKLSLAAISYLHSKLVPVVFVNLWSFLVLWNLIQKRRSEQTIGWVG